MKQDNRLRALFVRTFHLEGAAASRAGLFPLMVLLGLNAVDELDRFAFNVLSPDISKTFGLDLGGITGLVAALGFINLVVGLPIGFLADRSNRVRIARLGAAVWGAFSALTAVVPNVFLLGVARVGAGLGRSVNRPTHESLLADYYEPQDRTGVYAVHNGANSIGQIFGALLAGGLALLLGWRTPFLLLSIPTFLLVLLARRLPRASAAATTSAGRAVRATSWQVSRTARRPGKSRGECWAACGRFAASGRPTRSSSAVCSVSASCETCTTRTYLG